MKKLNQPVRVITQQSTQGVYEALLRFAEIFNPNDPKLLERGVTSMQLQEKRYKCDMTNIPGYLNVHIDSPDIELKCSLMAKSN
ncbi:hypothetical protein [Dysgonomonas sp. HGC4]|uniref:hypothetical protein n=1 Tax=Dysgonomonas sp. HGC4 TaxID=1658009 RepID=UPI00067FFFAE|nr:hypothetical protein [Dysgonomonas sp. HGC4]MBD8349348.1 hypothetical protein [Dysgonomonas sp. HGC4]